MPTLRELRNRDLLAPVVGTLPTAADGSAVAVPAVAQLVADLAAAKATILDLGVRLLTQQQITAAQAQLLHAIVGGDAVAYSLTQLYQLLRDDITSENATFADILAKQTTLEGKVTANTAALLLTAKASELTAVKGTADAAAAGLVTTNTNVGTLSAQVSHPTLGLGARVLRNGDTMSGPLNVMAPSASANPLQLGNAPAGGNRPLREFLSVKTTAVAGKDPGTGLIPLTDPLGLGRAAQLRYLGLVWKELPVTTLATTITLTDQTGAEVYSKVYAVGVAFTLSKVVDLLDYTSNKFPEVASGTSLYMTVSNGRANASADFALVTPNSFT